MLVATVGVGVAFIVVRGPRYVAAARFRGHATQYLQVVRASENALAPRPERYAFKGGVAVIDWETGLLNGAFHFRIPSHLRADTPDEVKTLAFMKCLHRVLGRFNGRAVEYTECLVSFIDCETQSRMFNVAFDSAGPYDEDTSPETKFVTLLSRMGPMGTLNRDQWWYFAGQQQKMLFLSREGLH